MDPLRRRIAAMGIDRAGGGFNPYAAGPKQYGPSGGRQATSGPVGAEGQQGYDDRDMKARAKRQAVLQRMQAAQNGNYMSSNYLQGGAPR